MTDTAIRATFSDCRTVKTRKVFQLILELPIEQANAALAALGGVPQFGEEQWVGVAPITAEPRPAPKKEISLAQRAGILGQDQTFWEFAGVDGIHEAADYIRNRCHVESRAEIKPGTPFGAAFNMMWTEYDAWRGRIGTPDRGLG